MNNQTLSEQLFERFCGENHINWSLIVPDGQIARKYPDYKIECAGNIVFVEIKEIGESPDDRARRERLILTGSTGAFNPQLDERVRKKIDRAMPQLRRLAKDKHPAVVVLYDNKSIIPLDGLEIRLAMYGQDIVDIGYIDNTPYPTIFARHRFGAGQKVSVKHNTTLSAVALLTRQPDQSLHLDFYHNKFAVLPFNPDWLRNAAVRHFQLGDRPGEGGLREWERV